MNVLVIININIIMKNIRDSCIEFFQNEEIRRDMREVIKPISNIIYNETYLYIWLLCFYSVLLLLVGLANLFLLIKIFKTQILGDSIQ